MTDAETAAWIRAWLIKDKAGCGMGIFSWPTDGAGYEQHIRFVEHRNQNWAGVTMADWWKFCEEYADALLAAADL